MNETLITDLVSQQALDQLDELDRKMEGTLTQFQDCARELARGIKIPVEVNGDLDVLQQLYGNQMQQAAQASQQLTQQLRQQSQVVANTTNTISRQLMEQERLNKVMREAFVQNQSAYAIAQQINGTYQQNVAKLASLNNELNKNKAAQKEVNKDLKDGNITEEEAVTRTAALMEEQNKLKIQMQEVASVIRIQAKEMQAADGSYAQLSQQLELLKKAQKSLNEEQKASPAGKALEAEIQNLDAHLKDLAADMGEFQRNVGNYAIASRAGVRDTQALQQALITEATSAKQAAEQNVILRDALERIRTTSPNAKEQIDQLNKKIEENEKVIREDEKASAALVDQMGQMLGFNTNLGRSFASLSANASNGGSVMTGLSTKLQAFGKTAMGLLTNPYMLAFLGIVGVAAGVKWWYEYNKGLVEASRQTKFFTGLTGEAMQAVRDKIQAVADVYDKDFAEVLKAATAISHNMGITVAEATDLISKGMAAGGRESEQYLNTLSRFAPTMEKMGLSADQFVAFAGQIEKAGHDTAKSMTALGKASMQLRTMNLTTAKSLQAIGIDAKQMSADMQTGKKSVVDAMQEIAKKIQETGSTSREVAAVMKDLFGARGESGIGNEFIQFLADAKTGTEELLGAENSLQRLKVKETETQEELNNLVAALFDMGDDGFESMTTRVKIWINEGLIVAVRWIVKVINYFIDLYNESMMVRGSVESQIATWKILWNVIKVACNMIIDAVKAVGRSLKGMSTILEGILTFDFDLVKKGFGEMIQNFKQTWTEVGHDIAQFGRDSANAYVDAFNNTVKRNHIDLIDVDRLTNANTDDGYGTGNAKKGVKNPTEAEDPAAAAAAKKAAAEAKKAAAEAEKARKKELKAEEAALEAQLELIDNYHEKELAKIRLEYLKKINAIEGNSEKERAARLQLEAAMNHALAEAEAAYQRTKDATNLQNHLASVKEGSEEEYKLKAQQLEKQYLLEIEEAKKTGADVGLINAKYVKQVNELNEEYNAKRLAKIAETASTEQILHDNRFQQELNALKEREMEELRLVGDNEAKIEEIKERYARETADMQERYAIASAQRQLDAYKQQINELFKDDTAFESLFDDLQDIEANTSLLEGIGLTHEKALEMAKSLAATEIAISDAVTEHTEGNYERQADAAKKARQKQVEAAEQWLQRASEAISKVGDLFSAMFDNQIAKIEELLEAEQQRYDQEVEHIEYLAERGAITSEEAEIRKREAAAATAAKQEQLEKKKAAAEYKKAVIEKANSIAQIGIATAQGIMQTYAQLGWPAGVPGAIFVGAMGAIQVATALAQPIKAYKEGTKGKPHPGGLALVGDGDKAEVVLYNGKAWVTPDSPTLVDLPKGAEVLPDAERVALMSAVSNIPRDRVTGAPIIINDYSALESRVASNTKAVTRELRDFRTDMARQLKRQKFNAYIARRI